jgi:hypothetical protein
VTPLERVAWRYGWFAERYGWTPTQVDEQPLWVINQLPVYASAVEEAKAHLRQAAQAEAERDAARRG